MKYQDYLTELNEISVDFWHASDNTKKHNLDLALQYVNQGLRALNELMKQEIEDDEDDETP